MRLFRMLLETKRVEEHMSLSLLILSETSNRSAMPPYCSQGMTRVSLPEKWEVIRSGSVMYTRSFSRRTTVKLGKEDNHETPCNEELCEGNVRMFYAYPVDGHNSRLCDGETRCRFCRALSSCDSGRLGHLQVVLHCEPPEREC